MNSFTAPEPTGKLMRSLHFTIAKNALANVMRGGASAVVAIALPHFLTHSLGHDRFAGWALMLQIAAYANYLDFGLQTAIARYLAGALEKSDCQQCNRLLSNALTLLIAAGVIAIVGLGIVSWQLPHLLHTIPPALAGEIAWGVLILGLSAAINLPLSAYTGALIGMQRNEFPAIAIGAGRLCGAVAVVFVAQHSQSLVWLAACIGGFNLAAGVVQYIVVRHLLPDLHFRFALLNRETMKELIRYSSTLSVWLLGMLLISGLDVTIVGIFSFQAAGAYSLAATLIMFFTGISSAAFSAMLAPVAVMQARKEYSRISRLVIVSTRLSSYLNIGVVVAIFLLGEKLITLWVGKTYLSITLPVLQILLIAQAIRLAGNGLGTTLIGMGFQRYGIVSALAEGVLNLVLSLLGIVYVGPVGVAWATLISAIIGLVIFIFAILGRLPEVAIRRWSFVYNGLLLPLVPFTPIILWLLLRACCAARNPGSDKWGIAATTIAVLVTSLLLKRGISGVRRIEV